MQSYSFSASIFLFWIKGKFTITSNSVQLKAPLALLGLFPAGVREEEIPFSNIIHAKSSLYFDILPLLAGVLLFITGIRGIFNPETFVPSVILLVIFLILSSNSLQQKLFIQKSDSTTTLYFPIFQRKTAITIANAIQLAVEENKKEEEQKE